MRSLFLPLILFGTASCTMPPPAPGRLTLSNFSFESARVEAVVTANNDCNARGAGIATSAFSLPLNGTRVIAAPPGADVCWRRELESGPETPGAMSTAMSTAASTAASTAKPAAAPRWSPWNRAYLSVGGAVDAQL